MDRFAKQSSAYDKAHFQRTIGEVARQRPRHQTDPHFEISSILDHLN